MLNVSTNDFLIIENNALGYKIKYLIKDFVYEYRTRMLYYQGFPVYEELKGSKSQEQKWKEKRLTAYYGSVQHFFKSLYDNKSTEEGYIIHKLSKIELPADSNKSKFFFFPFLFLS